MRLFATELFKSKFWFQIWNQFKLTAGYEYSSKKGTRTSLRDRGVLFTYKRFESAQCIIHCVWIHGVETFDPNGQLIWISLGFP